MDRIPIIAVYRGVGIHDHQTPARIRVVKAAIDRVARMKDPGRLLDFAGDHQQPPEARLFAAAKLEASHAMASEQRLNRPPISLEDLRAIVAGLDSADWRSPWWYGSLFDRDGVPREEPLSDD